MLNLRRRTHKKVRRADPPEFLIQKQGNLRFDRHTKFVRGHWCLLHKIGGCSGPVQAAHFDGPIPVEDRGGKDMRDHDKWTWPSCAGHHGEYHTLGWKKFEQKYSVDTKAAAEQMAQISPYRFEWVTA